MRSLSRETLTRGERIASREELLAFLAEIGGEVRECATEIVLSTSEGMSSEVRATAFLACAERGLSPTTEDLEEAMLSEDSTLAAAAALCVAACFGENEGFVRSLLLGPDPWHPSKVSRNARHFLIRALGTSGNVRFITVLLEACSHSHFCWVRTVARSLELLGQTLDEDKVSCHRSLSISEGIVGIVIATDERYGGGSNCVHCRYFPCRINHYYPEGIEDCKLWNRIDPWILGEIIDQRDWGDHHQVEQPKLRSPEHLLQMARRFLRRGEATVSLPLLCEIVIDSEFQSALQPAVWIGLARCFSIAGERFLEFIAMREASRFQNLFGLLEHEEREQWERFVDDPVTVLGRPIPRQRGSRFELRAEGYKKANLQAKALDCYAQALICEDGASGGGWFEMGECCRALGELWLAELFLRKAAFLMRFDLSLRQRFLETANAVRGERRASDPGLAIERRRADRAQSDPSDLCLVDPA